MVLLTSSSISVAISSGVVCLFTFLLFLSGYVVQQQTVRSLQAALHPPPTPTPTLPVYFQNVYESAGTGTVNVTGTTEATETGIPEKASQGTEILGFETITKTSPETSDPPNEGDKAQLQLSVSTDRIPEASPAPQSTIQEVIGHDTVEPVEGQPVPLELSQSSAIPEPPLRLAYVQLLSNPSQICSAILFFKLQREYGNSDIKLGILYPLSWDEDTSSDLFSDALALMRHAKDEYKITYRPVGIHDSFDDRGTERELIAHLATDDWEYDRIMYLRSPGLALDFGALDSALQASKTNSGLSRNWATGSSELSVAPPILLISDHTMYVPRSSNRRLTAEAFTSHANHHEKEMDREAATQAAAYMHFDEGELEHRREEKEWYGGVFERYERGRVEMCRGTNFDGDRTDPRR